MKNKSQSSKKMFNTSCIDSVDIENTCSTVCDNTVDFCCSTSLGSNFNVDPTTARVLYDLNCLSCIIEPCCTDDCCTRYDIKVVGCIPFVASAAVPVFAGSGQCVSSEFDDSKKCVNHQFDDCKKCVNHQFDDCKKCCKKCCPPEDDCPITLCCEGSVCVNNVICNVCSYEAAVRACAFLQLKLRSCSCVTATVNVTRTSCIVYFAGTFTLPDCSAPTNVNCTLV